MANETTFDLNAAIQRWRGNLAQSPAMRTENLNELESHLRDSIGTLQVRGLSEQEAFWVASRRIGGDKELETEFGKVNGQSIWVDRIFWMLLGVQVWGAVSSFTWSLSLAGSVFGWKMTNYDYRASGLALPVVFSTLLDVAGTVASLVFCWWLFTRKSQKLAARLGPLLMRRTTLVLSCVALCVASVLPWVLSLLPMAFMRHSGPDVINKVIPPVSYSRAIVGVAQLIALAWLTVYLARKRLRARVA